MSKLTKSEALAVLAAIKVEVGHDFHPLSRGQVECLLAWAKHYKYHKPKNANGSKARYFFAHLQRLAQRKDPAPRKFLVHISWRNDDGSGPSSHPTNEAAIVIKAADAMEARELAIARVYATAKVCSHVRVLSVSSRGE